MAFHLEHSIAAAAYFPKKNLPLISGSETAAALPLLAVLPCATISIARQRARPTIVTTTTPNGPKARISPLTHVW